MNITDYFLNKICGEKIILVISINWSAQVWRKFYYYILSNNKYNVLKFMIKVRYYLDTGHVFFCSIVLEHNNTIVQYEPVFVNMF